MQKTIVLALLVAFIIPVLIFAASADTLPVSGCYYIDCYDFCAILADIVGGSSSVSDFYDLCIEYSGVFPRLCVYSNVLSVGCIKYNERLYFELDLVEFILGLPVSSSDYSLLLIDGCPWASFDAVLSTDFDLLSVAPWPDVAPFISVVYEYDCIADIVSYFDINSVLDYILVLLPVTIGALVSYISVRKGYGYLRDVLNGS